MDETINFILQSASAFPPPPGVKFAYGTAGFRSDASLLSSTVFRAGIVAALRSSKTGSVIGLMITASHNQASDNGVKVADPGGGMLTQDWEPFAETLANSVDPEDFAQTIKEFMRNEGILFKEACSGEVLVARDTRPSGESLLGAAMQGIRAVKGVVAVDMGILTTPQLHWMVRNRNRSMPATEFDYYTQLSGSFRTLMSLSLKVQESEPYSGDLVVDGANGVGAEKLFLLLPFLDGLEVQIKNSGKEGEGGLNERVGADFVQKEKVIPSGFGVGDVGKRCASLDGDADRFVYFYTSCLETQSINLIDGDKILTLFAIFINQQLNSLQEKCHSFKLGIVQTAYANGASTSYLRNLGLEVVFTPTGVKYLHEKAAEYDIGIYFEANGHGTILFSEKFLACLRTLNEELGSFSTGLEQLKAIQRLLAVSKLINQATGDALSGILLVEAILHYMGFSIQTWNKLYQDLPSRQIKVKVADKTSIVTTDAETRVLRPLGLQEAIDSEVAKHSQGRAFVRPSGTEDAVRVYAEALSKEAADSLAQAIAEHVHQFAGLVSAA